MATVTLFLYPEAMIDFIFNTLLTFDFAMVVLLYFVVYMLDQQHRVLILMESQLNDIKSYVRAIKRGGYTEDVTGKTFGMDEE